MKEKRFFFYQKNYVYLYRYCITDICFQTTMPIPTMKVDRVAILDAGTQFAKVPIWLNEIIKLSRVNHNNLIFIYIRILKDKAK